MAYEYDPVSKYKNIFIKNTDRLSDKQQQKQTEKQRIYVVSPFFSLTGAVRFEFGMIGFLPLCNL